MCLLLRVWMAWGGDEDGDSENMFLSFKASFISSNVSTAKHEGDIRYSRCLETIEWFENSKNRWRFSCRRERWGYCNSPYEDCSIVKGFLGVLASCFLSTKRWGCIGAEEKKRGGKSNYRVSILQGDDLWFQQRERERAIGDIWKGSMLRGSAFSG